MSDAGADLRRRVSGDVGFVKPGDLVGGRYRIVRLVGVGGMGAVFAARDPHADELVAIKVMRPGRRDSPAALERFVREARAASSLRSAHVARVLQVGHLDDSQPFMAMEFLTGRSLDRVMDERGPLPVEDAVDFLLQACVGVAEAHARGIIHRDLKPSNLYLTDAADGSKLVKVLDFGIAKHSIERADDTAGGSLTGTDAFLGSPEYVSPEQVRSSKHVDARSDIWSLGLILHRLLTGRSAFEADNIPDRLAKAVAAPPTSLRTRRPDAPEGLEQAVLTCLRKDPQHRYANVSELAHALQPYGPPGAKQRAAEIANIVEQTGSRALAPATHPMDEAPTQDAAELAAELARQDESEAADELPTQDASELADAAAVAAVAAAALAAGGETLTLPLESRGQAKRRRARRARRMGIALAVAVGGAAVGIGVGLADNDTDHETTFVSTDTSAPQAVASDDGVSPSASDRSSAAAARTVEVRFQLEPRDAQIWIDGKQVTDNPVSLVRGDRVHEVEVVAPGFTSATRELVANEDRTVVVILERDGAGSPTRRGGGARGRGKGPRPAVAPSASVDLKGPLESTL